NNALQRPMAEPWLGSQRHFRYLCESVFSTLAYLKNKYRARLERENDMRLSLSTILPRIDRLCGLQHIQILHSQVFPLSTHTHTHTHLHAHISGPQITF